MVFYFCTESYSLEDNYKLSKILKNHFNLDCGVHKHTNGHRLYIFSKYKLLELVKLYLINHLTLKVINPFGHCCDKRLLYKKKILILIIYLTFLWVEGIV
jgi:LAGLIDADG DNA endonuclease family